ncbi:MAG: serine/threonine-protein kinase [Myxococcales bacterium]
MDLENLGLLGAGGEGRVWLARDRGAGTLFALKLVRAERPRATLDAAGRAGDDPDPPVLEPIEAGEVDGAPPGIAAALPDLPAGPWVYLLYPFVDGPSALELCDRASAWGAAETAAVLLQLLARLARLHPRRAHGDVKPENLLVNRAGRLFLADAAVPGSRGTPYYLARDAAGPAADVHAACAVGHVLWTRRFPREGAVGLPELPEPDPALPPERRRAEHELARLLREGVGGGLRPTAQEALVRLRAIAPALGAGEPTLPLARAVAASRLPERLSALERAIGAAPRPRPRSSAAPRARLAAVAVLSALAVLALAALLAVWLRRRADPLDLAAASGRPAAPRGDANGRPGVFHDEVRRAARLTEIRCGEPVDSRHGYLKIHVLDPLPRVAIAGGEGSVLWEKESPPQGERHCFDLAPGSYRLELFRRDERNPGGPLVPDDRELTLAAGQVLSRQTHARAQYAPAADRR